MCVSLYFSGLLLLFKAFFKEGSRFFQLLNNFFLLKCQTKKQHWQTKAKKKPRQKPVGLTGLQKRI